MAFLGTGHIAAHYHVALIAYDVCVAGFEAVTHDASKLCVRALYNKLGKWFSTRTSTH